VVLARDCDYAIADVLERHFLKNVGIELVIPAQMVRGWDGERWVDAVGWELSHILLLANFAELLTVDGADAKHFLLLDSELLILTFVTGRLGI